MPKFKRRRPRYVEETLVNLEVWSINIKPLRREIIAKGNFYYGAEEHQFVQKPVVIDGPDYDRFLSHGDLVEAARGKLKEKHLTDE